MENSIAAITPSPVRRFVSVSLVFLLGGVVIYLAFSNPPELIIWQAFLLVLGLGALMLGEWMRKATGLSIFMTDEALIDSSGQELCKLNDISGIDRGAFAFKPANGFLLRTKTGLGRSWSPGLWWRLGRRIGVGGATPGGQGKFMAEAIALYLAANSID